MRVVIAARKSDLAKIQAYTVGETLQKHNHDLEVEYHFRESLGDMNAKDPLWQMPEKGVFTEDFYKGLLEGTWDMVVHSWKDLPVDEKAGVEIAATLEREDCRDLLLFKKTSLNKKNFQILSSSPRRAYNLHQALPTLLPGEDLKIQFEPVRGNIQTRVRKLLEGEADGLVVAKAALDRLLSSSKDEFASSRIFLSDALKELQWMVLPLHLNPTAAAQGALAIEIKKDRADLKKLLAKINHEPTFSSVQRERTQLKSWGGGCHQKIGISVLERPYGRVTLARGVRDGGFVIDIETLEASEKTIKPGDYFPKQSVPVWFDREVLTFDHDISPYDAHWVSKAEALPKSVIIPHDKVVWTGGIKTWQNLARRGVWVNGSSESLGEEEAEQIEHLVPGLSQGPLKWCKWTHADGVSAKAGATIKTYKLIPKNDVPKLSPEITHFCWMSGSSFQLALKTYPWLKDKEHWSGPGHSYDVIRDELKKQGGLGAIHVALNFEEWQKKMHEVPK